MSGQVRNPKELESLQASLEALRRQHETVENQGVEALLKVEELTTAVDRARAALVESENKWKANQAALVDEETKLKRLFVQCKRQRETLAAALGNDLSRYEDLRQRKGGVAVAALERTMCAACHVQVPTGIASSARNENGVPVLCPSCGRILYAA
jgi:predicted  nucleic acid-binding Zn-ribbon protein